MPRKSFIQAATNTITRTKKGWLSGLLLLSLVLYSGCNATISPKGSENNTSATQQTASSESAVIEASPEWFGCKASTDCTVVTGVCSADEAVNQQHVDAFYSYRDKMNKSVQCTNKASSKGLTHQAQCVKRRCSLNPPDQQP